MSRPVARGAHVLVDMTPLEPGGRNGGAGLVATALVRWLSRLTPDWTFTLLTSADSDGELAALDAPNVQRRCVVGSRTRRSWPRRVVAAALPERPRVLARAVYARLHAAPRDARVAADLDPDVLFCPFTVPYYWRPSIPTVSIVYDLQHVAYPEFFSPDQRRDRERHLQEVCARAAHVVCISDFVRQTVIGRYPGCDARTRTIPLCVLDESRPAELTAVERLGLGGADFVVYPANFWPHKNHQRLIEAAAIYRQRRPTGDLKIVCTGAPNALMSELDAAAAAVVPSGFVFPGYVRPGELLGLLDAARGVIFPSLYEGFGMPVLEAMSRSRPLACSNVTSLPEIAGDAALYFDPNRPPDIARALAELHHPSRDTAERVARGRARLGLFGDPRRLAERYRETLRAAMGVPGAATA